MRRVQHTLHKAFRTFPVHLRGFSSTHCIHHPVKLASLDNQPTEDASTNPSLIILHGLLCVNSPSTWTDKYTKPLVVARKGIGHLFTGLSAVPYHNIQFTPLICGTTEHLHVPSRWHTMPWQKMFYITSNFTNWLISLFLAIQCLFFPSTFHCLSSSKAL